MATKDDVITENEDDIDVVEIDVPAGDEAKHAEAEAAKEKSEVVEEPDGEQDDDDGEQEDTRLAEKDESAEEAEERRNKHKLGQRQRQKLARQRERAELQELRQNYATLLKRLDGVETNTLSVNEGLITSKLEQVRQDIATADSLLADAVKNADGDTYAAAMRLRDDAKAQELELIAAKNATTKAKETSTGAPDQVTALVTRWKTANAAWYGTDTVGTAIAHEIDNRLAAEGVYQKTDPEYYRELSRRCAEEFKRIDGGNRRETKTDSQADNRRKGPPLGDKGGGANGNGSGKRAVFLSKDRVDAIKAAGDWDDPVERAKAIKAYEAYDREQSAQR